MYSSVKTHHILVFSHLCALPNKANECRATSLQLSVFRLLAQDSNFCLSWCESASSTTTSSNTVDHHHHTATATSRLTTSINGVVTAVARSTASIISQQCSEINRQYCHNNSMVRVICCARCCSQTNTTASHFYIYFNTINLPTTTNYHIHNSLSLSILTCRTLSENVGLGGNRRTF